MSSIRRTTRAGRFSGTVLLATLTHAFAVPSNAQSANEHRSIIDDWGGVQVPPAPKVEAVKLDPAKTVLLVMDLNNNTCSLPGRPRCVAALPGLQVLLAAARAKGVLIIHTLSGVTTAADIPKEVAPLPGEQVVAPRTDKLFGRMDKFFDSDLESSLRAKGIDTVLAVGTSANGAVLYTVSGAAARKFKVVVPVDGMPADTAYQEQFTAYQFMTGPVIRGQVTLTTIRQVSF